MPKLRVLGLDYCLGDIPSSIFHVISSNLTCLSFERGVAWMTDASISLLAENCKGLTQISLIGCRLLTSSKLVYQYVWVWFYAFFITLIEYPDMMIHKQDPFKQ